MFQAPMATYGKKKKGLLSSFSVFHDDKPEKERKEQRTGECPLDRCVTPLESSSPMNTFFPWLFCGEFV